MITVERSRTRARSLATALVVAATCCAVVTIAIPRRAGAQEPVTLLAASAERGVVLRWAWGDGERPIGWLVDRRAAGSGWLRLTPQPVTRVRDRAVARARLGERFARFEGILFSDDPRAELADPESYRSLQLLSADVDPDVARLLGLRYDDSSATTGVRYEYRLVVLVGGAERVAATSGMVEAGRYTPPAAPDSLRVAQGRRGLSLRWSPRGAFTAYHVYRGTRADGRDATRLNATPVVVFLNDDGVPTEAAATFFTDTTVRADTAYYQVAGIDAFGRVSRRSPALAGIVRDLMAPGAPTVHQARVAADTVLLTWDAPSDADLAGFQ
ncbi:MAG: hypothetical protein OEW77_10230, partial [Gemmatimonadota bacterium]|nr:hypothetical protein [Gemmatimonadota bacterium]